MKLLQHDDSRVRRRNKKTCCCPVYCTQETPSCVKTGSLRAVQRALCTPEFLSMDYNIISDRKTVQAYATCIPVTRCICVKKTLLPATLFQFDMHCYLTDMFDRKLRIISVKNITECCTAWKTIHTKGLRANMIQKTFLAHL